MIPFVIIGNPENRRVRDFRAALDVQGAPLPAVFSHEELLRDLTPLARLPNEPRWVRIDAFGENPNVERRLLALGFEGGPRDVVPDRGPRHGEVLAPRQYHRGLDRYLSRLTAIFLEKPLWRILNPPGAIRRLFNKKETWMQHRQAGIPVPEAIEVPVRSPEELRGAMEDRGWSTAYVKLVSGSSASGLGIFFRKPRERLMTTLLAQPDGFFNSARVLRLNHRDDIDRALGFILGEGAHIEKNVPKARLDRAFFDLRILVIDGEPAFVVVRQSHHPITNLHLGGWRGSLERLRAVVPPEVWEEAEDTSRTVYKNHGCFQLGIDVLLTRGFRSPVVIEANAFGDLLPKLVRNGRSVYEEQIHRLAVKT